MGEIKPCVCAKVDRPTLIKFAMRAQRLFGEQLGPDLFSIPAWEMLLDLYARVPRREISLTSLCGASTVPTRTALRTIDRMVGRNLLARNPDPNDGRRVLVTLTPQAISLLDSLFDRLIDILSANTSTLHRK